MCAIWKKQYNVTATSWGSLPEDFKKSLTHPNSACTGYPPLPAYDKCVQFNTLYGALPNETWGTVPEAQKAVWNSNNCNANMCQYLKTKYNVTSTSWGAITDAEKRSFKHPSTGCSGYPPDWPDAVSNRCGQIQEANTLLPNVGWGAANQADRDEWTVKSCNNKVCDYWINKHKITPSSWGSFTHPDAQRSWYASCPADKGPPPPKPPSGGGGGGGCSIS